MKNNRKGFEVKSHFLAVILLATAFSQACERESPSKGGGLSLGGLYPGESIQSVGRKYGQPLRTFKSIGFITVTHEFGDVIVGFDETGAVARVFAKTKRACDKNGVCVGSQWSVLASRGSGSYVKTSSTGIADIGDSCWVEFTRDGSLVRSIELLCQP
ncbi:hypothetical protein [Luteimonas vadosa]